MISAYGKYPFFFQQKTLQDWNIRDVEVLVKDVKDDLLFIHAFSGCDSTSAIFGKGKVGFAKLFRKCNDLKMIAKTVMNPASTPEQIGNVSAIAFKALYGSVKDKSLTKIRYNKYIDISFRCVYQPEKLPPTNRTAFFHGLRVFYQIMQWKSLETTNGLDLLNWRWMKIGTTVTPITTDADYAPVDLLHIIKCNCKSSNACSTNVCT